MRVYDDQLHLQQAVIGYNHSQRDDFSSQLTMSMETEIRNPSFENFLPISKNLLVDVGHTRATWRTAAIVADFGHLDGRGPPPKMFLNR